MSAVASWPEYLKTIILVALTLAIDGGLIVLAITLYRLNRRLNRRIDRWSSGDTT